MTIEPWEILGSKHLFPDVRVDRCKLPNGQILEPLVLEYKPEVTILALTGKQEVILVREYRHGVQETITQLPGGIVDEGQSPLVTARRELLEETGYQSDTIVEIGHVNPNPANYSHTMYAFLALDAKQAPDPNLDEADRIECFPVPFDTVIEMAKRGELIHSLTISTLFFALAYLGRIT
jgi:ADP-ribose pyrophosphatase